VTEVLGDFYVHLCVETGTLVRNDRTVIDAYHWKRSWTRRSDSKCNASLEFGVHKLRDSVEVVAVVLKAF
jgi:hypothetical protein